MSSDDEGGVTVRSKDCEEDIRRSSCAVNRRSWIGGAGDDGADDAGVGERRQRNPVTS